MIVRVNHMRPLDEAAVYWLTHLPAKLERQLRKALKIIVSEHGSTLTYGSGFSGSEICPYVLKAIKDIFKFSTLLFFEFRRAYIRVVFFSWKSAEPI